jgi:hypothetical protein
LIAWADVIGSASGRAVICTARRPSPARASLSGPTRYPAAPRGPSALRPSP